MIAVNQVHLGVAENQTVSKRSFEECLRVYEAGRGDNKIKLNDEEIILLVQRGRIATYALEKVLGDHERAVLLRRAIICKQLSLQTFDFLSQPTSPCQYYSLLRVLHPAHVWLRLRACTGCML